GVWADCLRLRKHVIHNDYPSLGNKKGLPEGHIRLRRHMSIPVFDDDKIVAVAGVGNKENPYDLSDVRQLSLLMNGMWEHLRNRRALEKIKKHSSTLEEQVQQLVERVRLNDRLALLGEISAGLAHELRNPLGSLMAGIKLLEREGKSREEKQTVFEILKKESERLNNALTDFLGYARPGRMQPVELDVSRMLTDIIRLIGQDDDLMGGSTIETDFDPDLQPLTADGDRVRQVIWNIMINGLKAMETPGVLHVRASSDDDWLRIDINDSGRGIAPENIEKIFNPFFSLSKGGTGLGLAIVRRIMQEHGGEIKVDSNAKSGTTFSVRFPLLRPEDNNF
ncbi:MAG: GAF domain-containing protein, partial [Deltaproteobacteria bacterium]|nr:GAF domain-containing protein [Deltaproteobacteria bacterium]